LDNIDVSIIIKKSNMKTLFNHITLAKVTDVMLRAFVYFLIGLNIIGLIGVVSHIIMNPSVIDNASFGIYG